MTTKSHSNSSNLPEARLRRIETRLTNFGFWLGIDLTVPPANQPNQPVVVNDSAEVHVSPTATIGSIMLAIRKAQLSDETDQVTLFIQGREVGTLNAYSIDAGEYPHESDTTHG